MRKSCHHLIHSIKIRDRKSKGKEKIKIKTYSSSEKNFSLFFLKINRTKLLHAQSQDVHKGY